MYYSQPDENILLEYWREERTYPEWFRQSTEVWQQTEDDFLGFCRRCWRILEIDKRALLYVETQDNTANIHFSLKRGVQPESLISELGKIRTVIFQEFPIITGWVNSRNRGLKAICRALGLEHYGVTMIRGECRGKVIEWEAFSAFKKDFVAKSLSM